MHTVNTPIPAPKGATRRRHDAAFKRKLIDLCYQRGASVAAIALEHGINANLLFKNLSVNSKLSS